VTVSGGAHGRRCPVILLAILALVLACARPPAPDGGSVLIFAAASLQTLIDSLAPDVRETTGVIVRTSYAASSSLARQIEEGAPADLFISADLAWMDYLESRHAIRSGTRVDVLRNRLVLIAPAGRAPTLPIAPGFPLAEALGDGRLAVADPEAVPAGRYAHAALASLGVWDAVVPRLAVAENVRAALLLVARAEAPLGIVYRTDALADPRVVTVDTFPASTHAPIVYPAAITANAAVPDAARRVLEFLQGPRARAVASQQGFE
jgi:molybdate transport system substrate-binding protein